ncbi:MAG: hypothetical protein CR975_02140 [Gammaproteobacteria bacterium]|nr:MAG: hypothetical protein CR975_02140 [Gammaproteobacteria bacterium]
MAAKKATQQLTLKRCVTIKHQRLQRGTIVELGDVDGISQLSAPGAQPIKVAVPDDVYQALKNYGRETAATTKK